MIESCVKSGERYSQAPWTRQAACWCHCAETCRISIETSPMNETIDEYSAISECANVLREQTRRNYTRRINTTRAKLRLFTINKGRSKSPLDEALAAKRWLNARPVRRRYRTTSRVFRLPHSRVEASLKVRAAAARLAPVNAVIFKNNRGEIKNSSIPLIAATNILINLICSCDTFKFYAFNTLYE